MRERFAAVLILILAACAQPLWSQEAEVAAQPSAPRTKLEAFEAHAGSVIVKGISTLGTIRGEMGSTVTIEAREFIDASSSKRESGVAITVKEGGRLERENISYVDFDEIDSLLRGIDYIAKVDKTATKLDSFEATYATRGDLRVTVFSSGSKLSAAISSGRIGKVDGFLTLEDLGRLRAAIASAKERLDVAQK